VPEGGAQAGAAAQRVADQVDPVQAEMAGQGGEVVTELLEAERAVGVRAVAVAAQVDGDHPPVGCQVLGQVAQHQRGPETAVRRDHRDATGTPALPIHPRAVDRCVPAAHLGHDETVTRGSDAFCELTRAAGPMTVRDR
jgi:hypothetical protein